METSSADNSATSIKPGSGGGGSRRGGWGPLRLIPRLPLPGIPVPRLPLPGIPGLGRRGGGHNSSRVSAAGTAASLTLSSTDASLAGSGSSGCAAVATATTTNSLATTASLAAAKPKPQLKPASDVLAGALARALSQSTIHPLDTLKVRLQANPPKAAASGAASGAAGVKGLSKFGQLVPPAGATTPGQNLQAMTAGIASLYKGVLGAASGAGIAIGAYFACYGFASNLLTAHTDMSPSTTAFVAGGAAAAGSSVVKVPLAVCIRSVQAGVYPNVFAAANAITSKAGARGLFTGFFPTLLEDVPDMAVKFAAYESMRQLHKKLNDGRNASPQEDFAMGALAGALAAGATTPLDVIKTRMMCAAASRPTMMGAAREVLAASGPKGFLAGLGARALSNGINSAVFFCFFEALRTSLQQHPLNASTLDNVGRAVGAWAAQARERAAGIPRAVSSLPMLVPLLPGSSRHNSGDGGSHHLGWATAGIGGGMGWLGAGQQQPLSLALPVGAGGSSEQQLMLLADAGAVPERSFFGGGGSGQGGFFRDEVDGGFSLSLLARASPLRIEHHSQIAMAMAALKGVEGGSCIPLDEE